MLTCFRHTPITHQKVSPVIAVATLPPADAVCTLLLQMSQSDLQRVEGLSTCFFFFFFLNTSRSHE